MKFTDLSLDMPILALSASTLTAIIGFATRSCYAAQTELFLPMCSGETLAVMSGGSSLVHCAGCYVAGLGLIGMMASAISGLWPKKTIANV